MSKQTNPADTSAHTAGLVKTEVLGHTLRIVTDDGDEFTDDIALIGDCHSVRNIANAARIVLVWNAHDPLVKALRRLLDSDAGIAAATEDDLLAAMNEGDLILREQATAVKEAREVLAKATK